MITQDWRHATPEQKNLWRLASALLAYDTITPVQYEGPIIGGGFNVYAATKMYIALELTFFSVIGLTPALAYVNLTGTAGATQIQVSNNRPVWDTTAAAMRYMGSQIDLKNLWFFSLAPTSYVDMRFNGYRLDII